MGALKAGADAPGFKLQNQDEKWVSLSELIAEKPAMLVFYPGDFTPVCTKQLCNYQDKYQDFVKLDLQVIGISPNSPEEHQRFRQRYGFAFDLLSDPEKKVFKEYGVTSLLIPGVTSRGVYLVSKAGKILYGKVELTPLTRRDADELTAVAGEIKKQGAF